MHEWFIVDGFEVMCWKVKTESGFEFYEYANCKKFKIPVAWPIRHIYYDNTTSVKRTM